MKKYQLKFIVIFHSWLDKVPVHGESIILFDDIYSSSISDQRYVSPYNVQRQVICHPDGVALGLEHKETLILHVMT